MYHPVRLSVCRSAAFSPFMICSRALPPAPELFILQNGEAPSPHSSRLPRHPPPPPVGPPQPWQPPACFPSLGIGLPQGPPKSRILQDLSLPGWLLSLSSMSSGLIRVVASARTASPAQAGECSRCGDGPHPVYPFLHPWTLGCFHLLTVVDHAALNMGVQTSESLFSVLGVHTQR